MHFRKSALLCHGVNEVTHLLHLCCSLEAFRAPRRSATLTVLQMEIALFHKQYTVLQLSLCGTLRSFVSKVQSTTRDLTFAFMFLDESGHTGRTCGLILHGCSTNWSQNTLHCSLNVSRSSRVYWRGFTQGGSWLVGGLFKSFMQLNWDGPGSHETGGRAYCP